MKNGRINERNSGHWSLDGEPKTRRTKIRKQMTADDRKLLLQVVERVIDCMAFDTDISEHGRLHPDAKFTDGGRFMLCLNRLQLEQLGEIFQFLKMKKGRLGATNFSGETKISSILETILIVCNSAHTDKDARELIRNFCLHQLEEQAQRDKRFKK